MMLMPSWRVQMDIGIHCNHPVLLSIPLTSHIYRPSLHHRRRLTKRGEILTHRVHIGHHPIARRGNLHSVRGRRRLCFQSPSRTHGSQPAPFRCTTWCRLSRWHGRWQSTVTLRFTVDRNEQAPGQATNVSIGDVILDKGQVAEHVRRAEGDLEAAHEAS